jgi:uncharacterized OB-fold protein
MTAPIVSPPIPVGDDPDTGGFFKAAARGALAIQFCTRCDEPVHLPRPRCPSCGCVDLAWREVSPAGRIYSWTVVRHQVHPAFAVPYTVVLVALTDHPEVRLVGHLSGDAELRIGQPVRVRIDQFGTGTASPGWMLTDLDEGGRQ